MEDKLITLAILTFSKAQILKSVLENEGIEAYIHNVNQILPVVSSGVRIRIKESDLPRALKITESSVWLSEDVVGERFKRKEKKTTFKTKILVPIDFSEYSMKACELGFNFAKSIQAEVVLLHVYYTPVYTSPIPYTDVFDYQATIDEEGIKNILKRVNEEINAFSAKIKEKIDSGKLPEVEFGSLLREGVPEEEILKYSKEEHPLMIIMGTRGKNQKDIDLIGSVTAEVIDRSKIPVLTIPEKASFSDFTEIKNIAFITTFDQRDLISFETFVNAIKPIKSTVSIIYLADNKNKNAWNEVKLAGLKEYFQKQYSSTQIKYDIVMDDDLLNSLDQYIKENQIDIITVPTYKRNVFSRLFNPGIARRMIFHSDTPLLVIK